MSEYTLVVYDNTRDTINCYPWNGFYHLHLVSRLEWENQGGE